MLLSQSSIFAPTPLVWLFVAWALAWKGLALWRAARNQHKYWFVALLVLNTAGILEIGYLVFVDKEVMKYCKAYWAKMKAVEASPVAKAMEDKLEDKENKA